jgi:hypothetical protein
MDIEVEEGQTQAMKMTHMEVGQMGIVISDSPSYNGIVVLRTQLAYLMLNDDEGKSTLNYWDDTYAGGIKVRLYPPGTRVTLIQD